MDPNPAFEPLVLPPEPGVRCRPPGALGSPDLADLARRPLLARIGPAADVIVALPSTLTGSIGVYGRKMVVRELFDRLGLTTGTVSHGPGR